MTGGAAESWVLTTTALTKDYGAGTGVHDIDLRVAARGIYALIGPNGAGKTTLLSLLAALRRPTSGHIDGPRPPRLLLVPDVPEFEPYLTAREVVEVSAWFGGAAGERPSAELAARVTTALVDVGLGEAADRRCGTFSRGMTQRLALAAARVLDPDVLILDEPTSALDPAGRIALIALLRTWARSRAIIVSSHNLADIDRLADRIGILRAGRLVFEGTRADLRDMAGPPRWRVVPRGALEDVARLLAADRRIASVAGDADGEPALVVAAPAAAVEAAIDVAAGEAAIDVAAVEAAIDVAAAGEAAIEAAVAAAGTTLRELAPIGADLEQVFLQLTSRSTTGGEAA